MLNKLLQNISKNLNGTNRKHHIHLQYRFIYYLPQPQYMVSSSYCYNSCISNADNDKDNSSRKNTRSTNKDSTCDLSHQQFNDSSHSQWWNISTTFSKEHTKDSFAFSTENIVNWMLDKTSHLARSHFRDSIHTAFIETIFNLNQDVIQLHLEIHIAPWRYISTCVENFTGWG